MSTFARNDVLQWRHIPSNADPIVSPTMAGGLFAIERKWFFESGSYDEGMKVMFFYFSSITSVPQRTSYP